ncbi:MAG: hypothetical protein JRE28_03480 [Deltaproteobacteria bacterium]|nr:hypothetical protein [Deltaproteobacteria bacterium]
MRNPCGAPCVRPARAFPKVNKKKSRVAKTDDTDFLGFTFKGTKIRWSDEAFHQFKWRIKRLTGRSWFVSIATQTGMTNQWLKDQGASFEASPPQEVCYLSKNCG